MSSLSRACWEAEGRTLSVDSSTHDIGRIEAFGALLAFKFDRISLIQGLIPIFLNGRKMNEYIFSGRTLDKSISLGTVEPFHYTLFSHV